MKAIQHPQVRTVPRNVERAKTAIVAERSPFPDKEGDHDKVWANDWAIPIWLGAARASVPLDSAPACYHPNLKSFWPLSQFLVIRALDERHGNRRPIAGDWTRQTECRNGPRRDEERLKHVLTALSIPKQYIVNLRSSRLHR